jgi:hypothetical protein
MLGDSTAFSTDSLFLAFINTELGASNGSAIKDEEALKKMVRQAQGCSIQVI